METKSDMAMIDKRTYFQVRVCRSGRDQARGRKHSKTSGRQTHLESYWVSVLADLILL